jgi:hypothetical protein
MLTQKYSSSPVTTESPSLEISLGQNGVNWISRNSSNIGKLCFVFSQPLFPENSSFVGEIKTVIQL